MKMIIGQNLQLENIHPNLLSSFQRTIKKLFSYCFISILLILILPTLAQGQKGCCRCINPFGNNGCIANKSDCAVACNDALCISSFDIDHFAAGCNTTDVTCATDGLCDGLVLPVELTEFKGRYTKDEKVIISWSTASEINNRGFEVMRSRDIRSWETIAFVEGHGSTFEAQDYELEDELSEAGLFYYQLKQMDFDGAVSNSEIISVIVAFEEEDNFVFYPNPIKDALLIRSVDSKGIAIVYNMLGRQISSSAIEKDVTKIDVAHWPAGQYVVEIHLNNGKRFSKLILK